MKKMNQSDSILKEEKDLIPIYVKKIDEVHDFIHAQKTLQETPLQKYLSLAMYTTMVVIGLMYSILIGIEERVRVSESKLDYVLESFSDYKRNITALNGTTCIQCHNTPDMMLTRLGSRFSNNEEFTTYVRQGGRSKNGLVMPPIPQGAIDDYALTKIWKVLK